MNLDEAGRQEILAAFKRRRNREYIAAIPLLFAFFLIGYSQDDPGFQILGLRGHGLALTVPVRWWPRGWCTTSTTGAARRAAALF